MKPAMIAALWMSVLALLVAGCGGGDDGQPAEGEPLFGFNEGVRPETEGIDLIAESGATFVRVPMSWAAIERNPGERNFRVFDEIADKLEAEGLRPLWVLTGAPCWAAAASCEDEDGLLAPDERFFGAYAEVAADVAQRYPEAIGLEVWNEPNIPKFWGPKPDARQYRGLLSATADRVHESGSDVPVVLGGPSPTTKRLAELDPDKIEFVPFILETLRGSDPPEIDAVGIHPYSLAQPGDPIEQTILLFERARDAALKVAPDTPIWVTEVGLTTAGSSAVSEQEQADGLAEIYDALAAGGAEVIAVHRFFDQANPPFPFEAGFGVVADDGSSRKPSFCSLAMASGADCEA